MHQNALLQNTVKSLSWEVFSNRLKEKKIVANYLHTVDCAVVENEFLMSFPDFLLFLFFSQSLEIHI